MKKKLAYYSISIIPLITVLLVVGIRDASASACINVLSSNTSGLTLSYRPGAATIDTLLTESGHAYHRIGYDLHTADTLPGSPALPHMSVIIAVPGTVPPVVDVVDAAERIIEGIRIIPVPVVVEDETGFHIESYHENPSHYSLSGLRPQTHAYLEKSVPCGPLTLWELFLSPVLYDANGMRAAVADSFTVRIAFTEPPDQTKMPEEIPGYVLNRDAFENLLSLKTTSPALNPFSSGDWYKISIGRSGMYSITGADLAKAGFPTGSVSTGELRMYYNGGFLIDDEDFVFSGGDFREIAIKVNDVTRDGIFNTNDSIIFYGEALSRFYTKPSRERLYYQNHVYSDTNVVWLTVSGAGAPQRIAVTGEMPSSSLETISSYRCQRHLENDYQLELVTGGKEWFWEAIFNTNRTFTVSTPGAIPGYPSEFRVGLLNQYKLRPHQVYVYLNEERATAYYFSESKGFIKHTYNGDLRQGNNDFQIVRKYAPGESNVSVRLDWIEVEYDRILSFDENHHEVFYLGDGSPMKFSIANARKSTITVFDTTDPYNVAEIGNTVHDASSNMLTFQKTLVSDSPTRFLIMDPISHLKATSIVRKNSSTVASIPSGANYIVISNSLFLGEAKRLADWRSRDSQDDPLVPMVVDFDDIVDEYNAGIYDPLAIRNFLKTVYDLGGASRNYYCCIFGDAIHKYKNLIDDQNGRNFVPSFSLFDGQKALTTDDYYCWFNSFRVPVFAMGRLCATDIGEAKLLVDKIIDTERNPVSGPWHNRILLVADDELTENGVGQEIIHSVQTESLDSDEFIPPNIERKKIMLVEYPLRNLRKPDVTTALLDAINDGYIITNYIGHGNDDLLAHEHILVGTRDIDRFANDGKPTLFTVFSCSVGKFTQLDNISLAEILHLKNGGGALAVVAGTEITYSDSNLHLNKRFFINIFDRSANPEHRIGRALALAKNDLSSNSNARFYMVFGDPASRLMLPRNGFSVANIDSVLRLQKLNVSGNVTHSGAPVSYDGTLFITARGPKINTTYTTANNTQTIRYTHPGRRFFFGEMQVSDGSFSSEFVVPKDLPSGTGDPCIYLYAQGQENEASGSLTGFAIGGLDPNAPDDRNGPEISLAFDGKNFDNNDYISRQPHFTATINDPSGVNIYGDRGHNITLVIDKKEIVVLTERYRAVNGHSTGIVEYLLPILQPGEHTLEMNAYDTYNNATKISVTANVVGSSAGDVSIVNLLNYPNPMGRDGTTFTFSLTDDTRRADIKVYSQSGRLVDTIRFPAGYGFNRINWKPPFSLANGVYFYKLSVMSVNGRKASKIEKLVVMK